MSVRVLVTGDVRLEQASLDINCSLDKKRVKMLNEKELIGLVVRLVESKLEEAQATNVIDFQRQGAKYSVHNADFHKIHFTNDKIKRPDWNTRSALFKSRGQSNLTIKHMFKGKTRHLVILRHELASLDHARHAQRHPKRLRIVALSVLRLK